MMELRRIVLVNWHMMPRADLELAGDAAILGQNRSADAASVPGHGPRGDPARG